MKTSFFELKCQNLTTKIFRLFSQISMDDDDDDDDLRRWRKRMKELIYRID